MCGRVFKESPECANFDWVSNGALVSVVSLFYGNMGAADLWHQKALAAFEDIDLPSSGDFATWIIEVAFCTIHMGDVLEEVLDKYLFG